MLATRSMPATAIVSKPRGLARRSDGDASRLMERWAVGNETASINFNIGSVKWAVDALARPIRVLFLVAIDDCRRYSA
jgi:hypothetical protein